MESVPAVCAAAPGEMTVRPPSPAGLMQRDSSLGGLSNSGIAMELFVSASIAKVHLVPVCSKLGVNDRTAAVAAAFVPWVIRLDRWLGRCGGGSEVGGEPPDRVQLRGRVGAEELQRDRRPDRGVLLDVTVEAC